MAAATAKVAGKPKRRSRAGGAASASASAPAAAPAPAAPRLALDDIVGKKVKKFFSGHGYAFGTITKVDTTTRWYMIEYDDGDSEEVSPCIEPPATAIACLLAFAQYCLPVCAGVTRVSTRRSAPIRERGDGRQQLNALFAAERRSADA